MAIDKKSDYVGNHGGSYVDQDGLSRQFTYVDHDKKTKISMLNSKTEFDVKVYRDQLIKRITDINPTVCPFDFVAFTKRGDSIEWDLNMLEDEGVPLQTLRDLTTLLEKRLELM